MSNSSMRLCRCSTDRLAIFTRFRCTQSPDNVGNSQSSGRQYSFQDLWFGSKNNEASSVGLESIQNQITSWSNCNERQFEQEHERSRWKTLQHSFVGFGFCVLETSTWNRRSQTTINTIISARNSGNCAILFQNGNLSIRCNYAVLSPLSKSDVLIIDVSEKKI